MQLMFGFFLSVELHLFKARLRVEFVDNDNFSGMWGLM